MIYPKNLTSLSLIILSSIGSILSQYMPYSPMSGPMGGGGGGGAPGMYSGPGMYGGGGGGGMSAYSMPNMPGGMSPGMMPMDGASNDEEAEGDGGDDGYYTTEYAGDGEDDAVNESMAESYATKRRRRRSIDQIIRPYRYVQQYDY